MVKLIDLTQEMYEDQPVYPTHQKTVIWTDTSFEDSKYMFSQEIEGEVPFTFETKGILLCDHGSGPPQIVHAEPRGRNHKGNGLLAERRRGGRNRGSGEQA